MPYDSRSAVRRRLANNTASSRPSDAEDPDVGDCPPVTVATLRADATGGKASVLYPDCKGNKVLSVSVKDGRSYFDASSWNIESVESLPNAQVVNLASNRIKLIATSTNTNVQELDLSSNGLKSLTGIIIPRGVTKLILNGNVITKVTPDMFPPPVVHLQLKSNGILSLAELAFPDTLEHIDMSTNTIKNFTNLALPTQTKFFACENCGIKSFGGVRVSRKLEAFRFTQNEVDTFDIANSSVPVYEALVQFAVTSRVISCAQGKLVDIRGVAKGCLLDDATYNSKYTVAATLEQQALPQSSASSGGSKWLSVALAGGGGLLLIVAVVVGVLFVRRRRASRFKYQDKLDLSEMAELGGPSTTTGPTQFILGGSSTLGHSTGHSNHHNPNHIHNNNSSGSHNSHNHSSGSHNHIHNNSHNNSHDNRSMGSRVVEAFPNDVRTDEALTAYCLLPSDVVKGKLLARGGYGAVFLATHRGETVVMKQMLPDKTRHPQVINAFMDEIRICATLDHPKVVRFLGITWTTLQDLSVVMEYMPNGDLAAVLSEQLKRENTFPGPQGARSGFGWFHANSNRLKCKSLIALDIAEALVYLHSFESPIIHRDLKPKNILMGPQWEAKLTDFGISREKDEDRTMTAEIGTVAWIAPEVLKGERYSEMADVYSFGVILAELDTCRRPFSSATEGGLSNTRIAVMVSAGQLKPSLHRDCPRSVRQLIKRCLAYRPEDRPSALQIHYELRNLELDEDELQQSEVAMRHAASETVSRKKNRSSFINFHRTR